MCVHRVGGGGGTDVLAVGGADVPVEVRGWNRGRDLVSQSVRTFSSCCIQIIAEWEGDFSPSSGLASFNSKYLLVPDWRASPKPEVTKQSQQIVVSPR